MDTNVPGPNLNRPYVPVLYTISLDLHSPCHASAVPCCGSLYLLTTPSGIIYFELFANAILLMITFAFASAFPLPAQSRSVHSMQTSQADELSLLRGVSF